VSTRPRGDLGNPIRLQGEGLITLEKGAFEKALRRAWAQERTYIDVLWLGTKDSVSKSHESGGNDSL